MCTISYGRCPFVRVINMEKPAPSRTENSGEIVIFEDVILKAMDINAERSLIIKELQQVNDISLLRAVKHLIHYGLKNEGHISVEQYNRELDEAEARVKQGEYYTQDDVEKMAKGW